MIFLMMIMNDGPSHVDTLLLTKRSASISRGSVVWYGSKFGTTTNEA